MARSRKCKAFDASAAASILARAIVEQQSNRGTAAHLDRADGATDAIVRFGHLRAIALDHAALHGIQHGGTRCTTHPCRLAGLSYALLEITESELERRRVEDGGAVLAALHAIEDMRAMVRPHRRKVCRALVALRRAAVEQDDRGLGLGLGTRPYTAEVAIGGAALVRCQVVDLDRSLARFADDLTAFLASPEVRQSPRAKPTAFLLRAVCQHLAWGGFSWPEIVALGLDGAPPVAPTASREIARQSARAKADRVRKLVADDDARTWRPSSREPDEPRIGKAPRRRSAGVRK